MKIELIIKLGTCEETMVIIDGYKPLVEASIRAIETACRKYNQDVEIK